MAKNVIDFGTLEQYIKKIESVLAEGNINILEQDLILRQAHERLQQKLQNQKMIDMTNNNPLVKLAKKFLPRGNDE